MNGGRVAYHFKSQKVYTYSDLLTLNFFFKRRNFVKSIKVAIRDGCNLLIIHNEMESYSNLASRLFNDCGLAVYILKPSPIIAIDSDWLWLRHLTSKCKWFLEKFLFEIFVPFFIFREILLTNKRWVPSNLGTIKTYCGPAKIIFCYDNHSKSELLRYFSNVVQIRFPNYLQYTTENSINFHPNKILIVPSNDAWFYSSVNKVSIDEAKKAIYKLINEFSKKCQDDNLIVEIKFKYEWQCFEFNSLYGGDKKIRVFYEGNVYEFAQYYDYVVGFNTTILLYLRLMGYQGTLISLQLIDHKFYTWYRDMKGVNFYKTIGDIIFSHMAQKEIVRCKSALPSLIDCIEKNDV